MFSNSWHHCIVKAMKMAASGLQRESVVEEYLNKQAKPSLVHSRKQRKENVCTYKEKQKQNWLIAKFPCDCC